MDSEYDVYVSCREVSGEELGTSVTAGLRRRGFRAVASPSIADLHAADRAKTIIGEAPDFVLLLTAGALDGCAADGDRMRDEIAHAIRTERNIVPVVAPGYVRPPDAALPPEIRSFDRRDAVVYSARAHDESIARIAHRLSSDAAVDERHVLRQARWVGAFAALVLLALAGIAVFNAVSRMFARHMDDRPLPPIVLCWSAFGQRLEGGRGVEFEVRDGGRMIPGDQLRVSFSANADGFAYVIARDLRGDITMLFPSRALKADSRVRAGEIYEAPAEADWFTVSEPGGLDAVYIVASYDPIENLESLVEERYEEASRDARQSLLQSTVSGLLDGRHAGVGGKARTRSGRPIVQRTDAGPRAATASITLDGGAKSTHPLLAQPGLVSAMAEIRVRYESLK